MQALYEIYTICHETHRSSIVTFLFQMKTRQKIKHCNDKEMDSKTGCPDVGTMSHKKRIRKNTTSGDKDEDLALSLCFPTEVLTSTKVDQF